jgi:DNA-dependent RNA polymerase auxiliary subunit epsilon
MNNMKNALLSIMVGLFAALGYFSCPSVAHSSPIVMKTDGSLISIEAHNVPLIDILFEIAEHTNLLISTSSPLIESTSCSYMDIPIEDAVRRLLKDYSYAAVYEKNTTDNVILIEIRIPGENQLKAIGKRNKFEKPFNNVPTDDHLRRYDRQQFQSNFKDPKQLRKQISANLDQQDLNGIRLSKVSEDSIFSRLGLRSGDVVKDVNGTTVISVDDFIGMLNQELLPQMLRINRTDQQNREMPIYIHFN